MRPRAWLLLALLLTACAYVVAEEITLTTYYPSPRGVYNELRTHGNTYLAIQDPTSKVGIGTATPINTVDIRRDQAGLTTLRIQNTDPTGASGERCPAVECAPVPGVECRFERVW